MVKNFLKHDENGKCLGGNYIVTGLWSKQCINQGKRLFPEDMPPNETASGEQTNYKTLPDTNEWKIDKNASYVHYCQNETVHGFEFHENEESEFPFHLFEGMNICCDMSSDIGARHVDWNKYAMVYCGAQKNLGAAGVTMVVVRKDLIG